jgi:thiol-disulfide isomerase/thioredoxin
MESKTKYITSLLVAFMLVGSVSALSINYFYSPSCPHCESVKPLVNSLQQKYSFHEWNFINVQEQNLNIPVPTLEIDGEKLIGSRDIPLFAEMYLNCNPNIQPQTTCSNGNKQTVATPNHQRPCSAPILFGGFE